MAGKRGRIAELAVALLLVSIGLNVHAKDVRVLSFSFEVPDTWEVDGKGAVM